MRLLKGCSPAPGSRPNYGTLRAGHLRHMPKGRIQAAEALPTHGKNGPQAGCKVPPPATPPVQCTRRPRHAAGGRPIPAPRLPNLRTTASSVRQIAPGGPKGPLRQSSRSLTSGTPQDLPPGTPRSLPPENHGNVAQKFPPGARARWARTWLPKSLGHRYSDRLLPKI